MPPMENSIFMQFAYFLFVGVSVITGVILYWYFCFGEVKNLQSWGLTSEELRQIPIVLHSGQAPANVAAAATASGCPICLEDYRRGDECRRMPGCGHLFHAQCVDPWLLESRTCPTCRGSVYV